MHLWQPLIIFHCHTRADENLCGAEVLEGCRAGSETSRASTEGRRGLTASDHVAARQCVPGCDGLLRESGSAQHEWDDPSSPDRSLG